ncbi:hypothetical protein FZC85_16580 [Rossellomorea aquimaris]|uniref:Uncharacterized protein n=1 Tax=Rossellomorea aquimaris TaxID=189382 RepID=A0A5D4UP19_9BACI|nr:hypothetical protein FZC85_16580 [Rossellomorea aquimaris]TYS89162.1 hypothetical protein FZC88_14030 [Rossellomorea aquimaris]
MRPVQLRGLEAHVLSQTLQEGKERLRGRFALCHPPLNKAPPLFFPQACRGGSRATRGKRSLARKSLAVIRTDTSIIRLYTVVF